MAQHPALLVLVGEGGRGFDGMKREMQCRGHLGERGHVGVEIRDDRVRLVRGNQLVEDLTGVEPADVDHRPETVEQVRHLRHLGD